VKREDLVHPYLSGNKWRKLKYNLLEALKQQNRKLLTFGGAHSNHIYATAAAGKLFDLQTIGIIRGHELDATNETLAFAKACGMGLKFISRQDYKNKAENSFLQHLKGEFGDFYLIPEGGTNTFAVKGCEEILSRADYLHYDFIAVMMGTSGTATGILNASSGFSHILGVSALKGDFMANEIGKLNVKYGLKGYLNYSAITQYHHGGYAKSSPELDDFIVQFQTKTGIPIEHVYSGKLFYALFDLIAKDFFRAGTKILAIHTGGLR